MGGIWLCDRQGNGCYKRGEFEAAVAHYTAALALTPTAAGLWLNRAVANLKLQRCVRLSGVFDPFAAVPRIDADDLCAGGRKPSQTPRWCWISMHAMQRRCIGAEWRDG